MTARPDLTLPRALRHALDGTLVSRLEAQLGALLRPCVLVSSEPVSDAPLARTGLGRLFGMRTAEPALPALASKMGGIPYQEGEVDWSAHDFVGQVDLRAIPDVEGLPRRGLLAWDRARDEAVLRVRWYPAPDAKKVRGEVPHSAGKWECRLRLERSWSLPQGEAWNALMDDEAQREAWAEWIPDGASEDESRECHRLFGYRSAGLDEPYAFDPPEGMSKALADYGQVLRLTFDAAADFAWGSHWIYVVAPSADLAEGRLDRCVCTGASY